MLTVLMEIMKQLKKLSSKLGGLLKLSYISTWGPSPGHSISSTVQSVNNSSVANSTLDEDDPLEGDDFAAGNYGYLTAEEYDKMSEEDRMQYANQRGNRLSLNEPEHHRYDKLPLKAPLEKQFNPLTFTNKGSMMDSQGNDIRGGHAIPDQNSYIQNPSDYKLMNPSSQGASLMRNRGMSSGREGTYLPTNTPGTYTMKATPRTVSKRDMAALNAQYLFRKPGADPNVGNTIHNTTGVRNTGEYQDMRSYNGSMGMYNKSTKPMKAFTDPVVNRRTSMRNYLNNQRAVREISPLTPVRDEPQLGKVDPSDFAPPPQQMYKADPPVNQVNPYVYKADPDSPLN